MQMFTVNDGDGDCLDATHEARAEAEDVDPMHACAWCLDEALNRAEKAEAERDEALAVLSGATCEAGDELHPLHLDGAKATIEAGDRKFLCLPCRDWQAGRL